jgi:hypothetical protein
VLVEDITDRPKSVGEEEDVEAVEASTYSIGQKRKAHDGMQITLPYLPDTIIVVDDMMGKVPKIRYANYNVCDATMFRELAEDTYLTNTKEIGPLGRPILDVAQWIKGLYNSGIMNLLDIPHFGCSKNVGLCVK